MPLEFALALASCSFTYLNSVAQEKAIPTREAPIAINGVGFLPRANKRATIAGPVAEFAIRETTTGREVLRGRFANTGAQSLGNAPVMTADFSALERKGSFQLSVPGVGESAEFRVGDNIYNWPFYCVFRAMYLCRCGCEVKGDFQGASYEHSACHMEDAYLDYVGGPAGKRQDARGGWHDAGDYNKYTVNGAFTAGTMLTAWEHFQDRLKALKLGIPESNNRLPDYLDEVRYELDWLLEMQAADGRVYHKVSALKYGGFILPEKETDKRYFSGWGSAATADLAAVMAQAARIFRPFDPAYAERCLTAARRSYAFLDAHREDHRPDLSAFATGGYDSPDDDDRLWAAAELWETTGEAKYLGEFERRIRLVMREGALPAAIADRDWDWNKLRNLGLFTYLLSKRSGRDAVLLARIRRDAVRVADSIVEVADRHPYGRTLGSTYYWGCNGTVVRLAMNLHVAQILTGDNKYEAAMLSGLDHVLGRNVHGRCYVTGLGFRPPVFPHDRRSAGDPHRAPWPGCLVGGPWPRAEDWRDDQDDYKTNEIAINWNGALIYALAVFVEPREFDESIAKAKSAPPAAAVTEQ